jgi:dihydroflavonol-4-reductase
LPVEIIRGSFYDIDSLKSASKNVDYILHIAGVKKAKRPREYHNGNVLATKNLLEAALSTSRLKKFTFISSITAAGPSPDGIPLTEDSPGSPITTYGVTKLEAETVCHLYSSRIPITILRPPAVYGPRDRDILLLFRLLKRGFEPVFGDSTKQMSQVYAPELARAIVESTLSERTAGETYFVSDPLPYLLTDALEVGARIMSRRTIRVPLPSFLLYTIAGISELALSLSPSIATLNIEKARDLLQKYWTCTPQKLYDHIGFRTQVTLEDGLRRTIQWYQESGWL